MYLGVPAILGVLVARRLVFDPPAWCGAASTNLCGGHGDPHPSWRSTLVKIGIKVTVRLGVLGRDLDCREVVLLVSASIVWSRIAFVANRTTG